MYAYLAHEYETEGADMASKPTKYHLSLRVEPDIAAGIDALREPDETQTGVYNRVLRAGVETLGRADREEQEEAAGELVEVLRGHINTLTEQLNRKDEQIAAITVSLQAAQALHKNDLQNRLIEAQAITQEAPEYAQDAQGTQERIQPEYAPRTRRGLFARIFGTR